MGIIQPAGGSLISVGSTNQVKIGAVSEAFAEYFPDSRYHVTACKVESGVAPQPLTLDETIRGAKTRALRAFPGAQLSVGLEGGLQANSEAGTGYFEITACAIFDGLNYFIGLSSGFEHPQPVIDLVLKQGANISSAYQLAGFTVDQNIGAGQGAIGLLSKGRLDRKGYSKQAIFCALISFTTR